MQLKHIAKRELTSLGILGTQFGGGQTLLRQCINLDALTLKLPDGRTSAAGEFLKVGPDCLYLQHDLTQPLPFENESFAWAYSEHFIEHIDLSAAVAWLKEVRRILTPGGVLRISTPDLARYAEGYQQPGGEFFALHRERLLAMGVQPSPRKAWMMNQIFRFWGHQWLYDFDELRFVLGLAGFAEGAIQKFSFRQGQLPPLAACDREIRSDESLYVEAVK